MKTLLLFLLLTIPAFCQAPELIVVEKTCVLAWDATEGAVRYGVEFQKQGSSVWSRFVIGNVTELKVTFPAGTYKFRIVGLTADNGPSDPGPELEITFI